MEGCVQGEDMKDRNKQRQRDMAAVITYIAALALMAVAMVSMPRPALSQAICAPSEIYAANLEKIGFKRVWSGKSGSNAFVMWENRDTEEWGILRLSPDQAGTLISCYMAGGRGHRLYFGDPS